MKGPVVNRRKMDGYVYSLFNRIVYTTFGYSESINTLHIRIFNYIEHKLLVSRILNFILDFRRVLLVSWISGEYILPVS